jgi:hypothetical protein
MHRAFEQSQMAELEKLDPHYHISHYVLREMNAGQGSVVITKGLARVTGTEWVNTRYTPSTRLSIFEKASEEGTLSADAGIVERLLDALEKLAICERIALGSQYLELSAGFHATLELQGGSSLAVLLSDSKRSCFAMAGVTKLELKPTIVGDQEILV